MLIEAHSQARPGRPVLLVVLTGVLLAGALGLAWWQVRDTRALGPPMHLPRSPLVVRPPAGWRQSPERPNVFFRPIKVEVFGRERYTAERTVGFGYRRWPSYQPPIELASQWVDGPASKPEKAMIGAFEGVQIRTRDRELIGRTVVERDRVVRVACSPRGDEIVIQYAPLRELTIADLEFLDEIAKHVELDDPAFRAEAIDWFARVGLALRDQPGWRVSGPDFPGVPGMFLQPRYGARDWSLGVFRTWTSPQRDGPALLRDFAATYWQLPPEQAPIEETRRADGARVSRVAHPAYADATTGVCAAWVLVDGAEAAMVFAFCSPAERAAALRAAEEMLTHAQLHPDVLPDRRRTTAAGATMVAGLPGELDDWVCDGAAHDKVCYLGTYGDARLGLIAERGPSAAGYRGTNLFLFAEGDATQEEQWAIERGGIGFAFESRGIFASFDGGPATRVLERRVAGQRHVTRLVEGARPRELRFAVGPAYVAPPLESLAERLVAQELREPVIIEASTTLGPSTHERLLCPLPDSDEGRRRLLVLEDYCPRGLVLEFDADHELHALETPGARLVRSSGEALASELGARVLANPPRSG